MLADENAYADAMLKPTADEQADLLRAMLARGSDAAAAPALEKDGWTYSSAIPPGATHARYIRRREGGEPELLIDESARAEGQPYFRSTGHQPSRSEEHTSELQSLMRISYAVFCLKKKTTK